MKQPSQDIRNRTLNLLSAGAGVPASDKSSPGVSALIKAWLASLDEEDLADIVPENLAAVLQDGFSRIEKQPLEGCRIETLRYRIGSAVCATALLIANPDMPFLVDSIVMALRRLGVGSRAVLNAVLSVRRAVGGELVHAGDAAGDGGSLESYVLCLLPEQLAQEELANLAAHIRKVASDVAAVRRDTASMLEKMSAAGGRAVLHDAGGGEAAAFLDWAGDGGFEPFGYVYYRALAGGLTRDGASGLGVLQDQAHPVYHSSLAGIPEDFHSLAKRAGALCIVKADVRSTLHRDQQLDFIGVRDTDTSGAILGEHCFIGLFSRMAAATALEQLPFARDRLRQVLRLAGVREEGFRAEKFLEILESLPRAEVLEADPQWLAKICGAVVALYKQPRAKVFARRDQYGRHLNVLVYMPQDRYGASLTASLAQRLRELSGTDDVHAQTLVTDGPLARVYLIARAARPDLDLETGIETPLLVAVEGWHAAFTRLVDASEDAALRPVLRKLSRDLPAEYVDMTPPQTAYRDLSELIKGRHAARVRVHIDVAARDTAGGNKAIVRLLSLNNPPALSKILPALHNAGIEVDREKTHAVAMLDGVRLFVTCLVVDAQAASKLAQPNVTGPAREIFELLFNDEAEDGRLNGLAIEAGLRPREVQLMRAYASYWRQAGCRFSLRYIADCLRKQPAHVRALVDGFLQRFDPDLNAAQRRNGIESLTQLRNNLEEIDNADTEDILRSLADLMLATVRTSYFQTGQRHDAIILKFDCSDLALLPEPRPYREIFVFSRRFEGVHLRGGPVARGGLRWSDRMEDYRTEVLGLVKAQMVKNAVIVPAGAKGGFVCKMLPGDAPRESIAAEGEAVYRLFIAGLLDVTDNRVHGDVVHPARTVCYDEPDPYLVVAADKGTASFSDIANGIAVERGFWLGDAFASGGSNGYDHKKLGITAKGAWEAVKRHFYEIGHDLDSTPITVAGVGDMSGDVFGNGMLLSRRLKLVAAFDHRHIFIDPNPDMAASFLERQRLFALPRSSWADYDPKLISTGGGVWPRSARNIDLSPQARSALGTDAVSATPAQLLRMILLAPVDLFYNGGIGTYIKASSESHAQVKDRANDAIRVDGAQLRCKVVAEGGNLGVTQAGRIEFALNGGHVFTDAIDNSAGVDCSDHEVNIKIWLDTEVAAGTLDEAGRNRILMDIAPAVEALVLRDNAQQTRLLAREEQAQRNAAALDGYAALIADLEAQGVLSRELEQLPSVSELARRKASGAGMTAPELAVVIAHVKNRLKRMLAAAPLLQQPWAGTMLTSYFPSALVATRDVLKHPLANAVLATVLANEAVNRCGPLLLTELARAHRVTESDVIHAWAYGWWTFNLVPAFFVLDSAALKLPCATSKALDQRTRGLQKTIIEGVLSLSKQQLSESGSLNAVTRLCSDPGALLQMMSLTVPAADSDSPVSREFGQARQFVEAIDEMAGLLFAALALPSALDIKLPEFLRLGMNLRRQAGIDQLERRLADSRTDASQEPLRCHALHILHCTQQRMLQQVLRHMDRHGGGAEQAAQAFVDRLRIGAGGSANADPQSLEHAVLDVWVLAEAVTCEPNLA
jgi:glutamate dehydrogenase